MLVIVLALVAAILAAIDLIRTRLESPTTWAVLLLAIALVLERDRLL